MRKGMTRRYRTEKLAKMEAQLEQRPDNEEFQSQAYGEHDPFVVPLNDCDQCGNGKARIKETTTPKGARYFAVCEHCGHRPTRENAKRPWLAALDWNGKNLATAPHYTELPLFGLMGLTSEDARERLVAFRSNLELRRKSAGLRRSLRQEKTTGKPPPGRRHQQKLDAYLKWAMYSLRVLKFQAPPIKQKRR